MFFGRTPKQWVTYWFQLSGTVDRKTYLYSGLFLMAARIISDVLVLAILSGPAKLKALHPLFFMAPTFASRGAIIQDVTGSKTISSIAIGWMVLIALPMLWIGVSMSFRRARDIGISQWWGMLFFLPILNFVVIAAFCVMPTSSVQRPGPTHPHDEESFFKSAMTSMGVATLFGVVITAFAVLILGDYGASLFVATPVVLGTIAGWRVNHPVYRGLTPALSSAFVSTMFCGGALLVFALEGIVCLAMVAPLVFLLALVGGALGAAVARVSSSAKNSVTTMALVIPIIGTADANLPQDLPLYEMTSEIHVDAPPEVVWPNVVGFSELPPPADWLLNTGIACPLRARIEGEGVGAVRYCEFTTGPFVEPITVWDPPNLLAFNVTEQPDPMHEWSPYEEVYAPHLDDTMLSQKGQFELIRTDAGTLLRGTTWYTLDLAPGAYWRLWSDFVVHRIHMRVLKHVKQLSEDAA